MIKCRNGTFIGTQNGDSLSFIGVPYAAPPVGNLRWQPPQPPASSDKIFHANKPSVMPLQVLGGDKKFSADAIGEDCLKLNIWLNPNDSTAKKPVMVYFHGGGYLRGSINAPLFNGENFVRDNGDMILIVVGFRFGVMGFIDFSGVDGGENFLNSAHIGLLDQIQALRWIHENIAEFGGDPDNVTIFGHSSGASSCSFLMGIAEARRYFRRCIAHSGTVFFSHSKNFCRRLAPELLRLTGKRNVNELMALTAAEIFELLPALNKFCTFRESTRLNILYDFFQLF